VLTSVEGVYRAGKIELTELPGDVRDETRVIVTFLETSHIDLRARGIDEAQAAELRAQLEGPLPRSGTVQTWLCTMIMMPTKPSYKRGDVVLVLYPNSDLRTAKTRPALIV